MSAFLPKPEKGATLYCKDGETREMSKPEIVKLTARSGWTVHLTRSGYTRILDIYAGSTNCDNSGNFNCGIKVPVEDAPSHAVEGPAFFDVSGGAAFFATRANVGTSGSVNCTLRGSLPNTSGTFSTQLAWVVKEGS